MKRYIAVILSLLMMMLSINKISALSYKYKKVDYTYHYQGRTLQNIIKKYS